MDPHCELSYTSTEDVHYDSVVIRRRDDVRHHSQRDHRATVSETIISRDSRYQFKDTNLG